MDEHEKMEIIKKRYERMEAAEQEESVQALKERFMELTQDKLAATWEAQSSLWRDALYHQVEEEIVQLLEECKQRISHIVMVEELIQILAKEKGTDTPSRWRSIKRDKKE